MTQKSQFKLQIFIYFFLFSIVMSLLAWILGLGALLIILLILLIISFVFWLVMLLDAVKRKDTGWIILFVFCAITGVLSGIIATIYYFVAYKHHPLG